MIVVPCARCTSSIYPPPTPAPFSYVPTVARSTNGHRFVFHSSEIIAEERLHVRGEPGVINETDTIQPAPLPQPHVPSQPSAPPASASRPLPWPEHYFNPSMNLHRERDSSGFYLPTPPPDPVFSVPSFPFPTSFPSQRPASPPARDSFPHDALTAPHLPPALTSSLADTTLEMDIDGIVRSSHALFTHARETVERARRLLVSGHQQQRRYQQYQQQQFAHYLRDGAPEQVSPTWTEPPANVNTEIDRPESEIQKPYLMAGDVLYWHHLARHGELPGVKDDERARSGCTGTLGEAPAPRTRVWCAR